jgi:RimJ/RimL family protein N-acetyltransferase
MVAVRPPAPAESGVVSELILQSDCGMLPALFGPGVPRLLAYLLSQPANPYCTANTLVIVEAARLGGVAGALVGSCAEAARRTNLHTAALLFAWYGPAVIARFPRLVRAGAALENLEPSDFYVSHIAVLPALRGRGFGKELLLAAEDRARQEGARRCLLDAEEHNERARSFYERLGYREESPLSIGLGRRGVFSFIRLLKEL